MNKENEVIKNFEIFKFQENMKSSSEKIQNEFQVRDMYQSIIVHDLRTPTQAINLGA